MNNQLSKHGTGHQISSLEKGLSDGVTLPQLLHVLGKSRVGEWVQLLHVLGKSGGGTVFLGGGLEMFWEMDFYLYLTVDEFW